MPESLWIEEETPHFGPVDRDLTVDVAIIGGGITGLTTAYLLKQAGASVAVLERGTCGQAETGNTTAHLTYVTDVRPSRLEKDFGQDGARAVWTAGLAAMQQIFEIVHQADIDCDFGWIPAFLHSSWCASPDAEDRSSLKADADAATTMGFSAKYIDDIPFVARPGVSFANQAKFHPLKYIRGLVNEIPGATSSIYEHSEASAITDDPLSVSVGSHRISCGHLVIATHVPLMGNSSLPTAMLLQTKLAPYMTYAIAAKIPKDAAPEALFWDTHDPYHFLRIDRRDKENHDYLVFGGEDHKSGQEPDTPARYRRLEDLLATFLPPAEVTHRWSGQVIETADGLPLIGETGKRQLVATGFAGNGMTFGTLSAVMARDIVVGNKNPWSEVFDPHRSKWKGATWDYVKENLDYPYYMVKDRVTGVETKDLQSVHDGEGKIARLNGKRLATYRDDEGRVTTMSAICPHMGCVVHWNSAEETWDCPCHGSRFKATGEVMSGPAESPLTVEPETA